jgi:DNA-binding Lrp family transcriptional regulator
VVKRRYDEIDLTLLGLLQHDASGTLSAIGERVGLSASAVQRRIRYYEATGIVDRRVAVLNHSAVGEPAMCILIVDLETSTGTATGTATTGTARDAFHDLALHSPAVQQLYDASGGQDHDHDHVLVLAARDPRELEEAVDHLRSAPMVKRLLTIPIGDVVKATLELPIA